MKAAITSALPHQKVVIRTLVVAVALGAPFLVHLLPPIFGTVAGVVLLPMFYAPLVASTWRLKSVTVLALFLPLANMLLTGLPDPVTTFMMTFEVGVFLVVGWNRKKLRIPGWLVGPAGYFLARVGSVSLKALALLVGISVFGPLDSALYTISSTWPGLLVLTLLSWWLFRTMKKRDND